jgi:hypothetical protein
METKLCKHCGRDLPVSDFYTNSKAKDGLATYCKECSNALSVEYTRKRRERKRMEAKEKERIEFEKKYKIYTNKDLAKFNPRELMLELKARGYEGELVFREVKVTEHRINLGKLE